MIADRWRMWVLTAIGAVLLMLTGVGLWRQHVYDTDGFIITALVQGAFYLAAVALTWHGGLSRRAVFTVLAVAALMRLAALLAPPYLSDDINRYVWDGRVEAAGINPYISPQTRISQACAMRPSTPKSTATTMRPPSTPRLPSTFSFSVPASTNR